MEPNETSQLNDWAEATMTSVQMYYTPVLVSLGTLGNGLSVYVFFGTKMRRVSSSWYLSALVISDTGFLISLLVAWLNMVGVGIFNRPGYCQFFVYLPTLCSFLSVWFVVSFTIERFVAVRYPLRRQSMCTVARAKTILMILTLVGLILCSPVLWFTRPRVTNKKLNTTVCLLAEEWADWARVFNIADTVLTFVLPFTVIVVLNGLIVKTVWRLARVRRTLTTSTTRMTNFSFNKNKTSQQKYKQSSGTSQSKVTNMLLVVSSFFLCFNLPAYVMRVRAFLEENDEPPRAIVITQHICNLLFDTNFGINFVLYCASGQNFRKAVVAIILRRKKRWNSGTRISNHASESRKSLSESMARQRTIVYEVPWTEEYELQSFSRDPSRKTKFKDRRNSNEDQ
ncbi:thyrotropin-releasing hormone receptor-like [Microplitis mediator]|uniref:thyrotropin-releasing hormone receptor-like n=1 Tax=Microplitis mediator TaxID=375433 RepID=UPI002552EDE1|nr:thyrotropin-releasing hormone receptor-like [Microplitis mediator]